MHTQRWSYPFQVAKLYDNEDKDKDEPKYLKI